MALKIIGAGFGRTGTLSMKAALEQLGYFKCHHMVDVIPSPKQVDAWLEKSRGNPIDWEDLFEGFEASVDFPSSLFYKELAEFYPEAKVILTVRPPDGWYESTRNTLYELDQVAPRWIPALVPQARKIREMTASLIWEGVFKGNFEDKTDAIVEFERHIDEVKEAIPRDRLLIMEVRDGWAPLCAFLGVPEPQTPFPNVNDTEEFQKRIKLMKQIAYLPLAITGVLAIGIGYATVALISSFM